MHVIQLRGVTRHGTKHGNYFGTDAVKADSHHVLSRFSRDNAKRLLIAIVVIVLSCTIANAACSLPGDTDNDNVVTITEVQQIINAFLGIDTARTATIAEVQQAINAFLGIAPTYVIAGKITNRADGGPFAGVTLTLYHASTEIIPVPGGLYGAQVTTGNIVTTVASRADGTYAIGNLFSGSYILRPSRSGYLFNPDKTAVMTITDSCDTRGNVYLYDTEKTGNTVIGNIIYNSVRPMTGNEFTQDFEGSTPGGSGF